MTSVLPRVRLVRDRPTWLIYLQLGTFASYLYGLSAALPLLRADQGTSATVAGLHGTAMALGTIAAGLALSPLTRRYGRRVTSWAGLAGMNAGVLLVLASDAQPLTLLGYGVSGGFSSILLYTAMAALSDHHGPAGPAAISEANAVGVVVGMGMTFGLSMVAQSTLGWRAALLVTPVASVLLALAMGRVWPAVREAAGVAGGPAARPGWRFHMAGLVLFCCVAMEFTFNLWAADLFASRTGLSTAAAATGLTAFVAGMAAGRFAGAQLALRLPPAPLFAGALTVTFAGWLVFWLSTHPALSYAGLALCGLGTSLHFPLAMTGLITGAGGRSDLAAAASPIWAGAAMAAGPLALGALADGFGTRTAFLMVPVLIGLAVAGVLISSRRS
ncbi:MFS transporter [Nonomuraea terrae]|uniref:MFS transporter n=1 Tax=Nonomuraea terrae TaxID=2530383 RepID=A0A4V2YM20_9ACTN|nr:MFS transporter [Nonomuraea terrae]TDD47997.1 MFS transporter [Nonomuraea terrae]